MISKGSFVVYGLLDEILFYRAVLRRSSITMQLLRGHVFLLGRRRLELVTFYIYKLLRLLWMLKLWGT